MPLQPTDKVFIRHMPGLHLPASYLIPAVNQTDSLGVDLLTGYRAVGSVFDTGSHNLSGDLRKICLSSAI